MWPAILKEAQSRIRALGQDGYKVVVLEAAVMIKAQWYKYCHQLWSVIIPPEEVSSVRKYFLKSMKISKGKAHFKGNLYIKLYRLVYLKFLNIYQ